MINNWKDLLKIIGEEIELLVKMQIWIISQKGGEAK